MSGDGQEGTSQRRGRRRKIGDVNREWSWEHTPNRETRKTNLSFGLLLFDSVTEAMLDGSPEITLEEVNDVPVRTPSGYHAFNDVPAEFPVVHLTVDAGEQYFTEERTVVLDPDRADYDPDDPEVVVVDDPTEGVRIELTPTPAYRFQRTYTHLRGHVYAPDGRPVQGATVSMPEFGVETRSVKKGEFVLYVPVEKKHVYKTNGKKYVKLNGASNGNGNGTNGGPIGNNGHLDDPTVEASHPDHGSHSGTVEIEPGRRTVYRVTLE